MLVVGTHDRRGVDRLMLGSVSHDLLLNVRIPTVVVRSRESRTVLDRTDGERLEDDA